MAQKGGKRSGAGRPKGAANKATDEARARAAEGGELPLDYMLRVMRDAADEKRRDTMAIAAAPYVHNRLASIEHGGKDGSPIKNVVRIERVIVDPANDTEDTDPEGVSPAPAPEDVQGS